MKTTRSSCGVYSSTVATVALALVLLMVAPANANSWSSCTPTTEYPVCNAPVASSQRVRKEVRSLSMEEWDKVVAAMWVMRSTELEEGQAQYGSAFRPYDYFVLKHAIATTDTRGDQAHFGALFISWHAAFVLEFENALLSVDPSIGAMPYWDGTIAGPSVFSADYFGEDPADTSVSYDVVTGKFANWPVNTNFSFDDWRSFIADDSNLGYTGGDTEGILRGTDNLVTSPVVTRYGSGARYESNPPNLSAWWSCAAVESWTDWQSCIEAENPFHGGPHGQIGGRGNGGTRGDFEDPITSPNGPLFMFHHANLDRNRLWFMQRHAFDGSACTYFGFPVVDAPFIGSRGETGNGNFEGAHLNDVVASIWGFTASDLGFDTENDDGSFLTHADLACWMSPSTAAYTYDSNAACLADSAACHPSQGVVEGVEAIPPTASTPTTTDTATPVAAPTSDIDATSDVGGYWTVCASNVMFAAVVSAFILS